ncbi:hypothetical protein EVAR_73888_1 [Eumeta japonica]|uniref:Uncharacterized protein n=1 Tax=Eumeta variegata TaxID=151549 RepID=A0A4C1SV76_EUMVA|nr:hypothetical protein EVAR_73888_1 [Eumeta japonica]
MAPPLRPGMPPGMQPVYLLSTAAATRRIGPQNGPGLYKYNSPQQHVHNMQMNRSFAAEGPGKAEGRHTQIVISSPINCVSLLSDVPTVKLIVVGELNCPQDNVMVVYRPSLVMQRQGNSHVSSSTHPQNMVIRRTTRSTITTTNGSANATDFYGGPPGQQHQNYAPTPPSGPNNPNFMNNSAAAAAAAVFSHTNACQVMPNNRQGCSCNGPHRANKYTSPNAMQKTTNAS